MADSCLQKLCLPGGSDGEETTYDAEDSGFNSGLGRSPGEGNGNSLQYACLENSMDRPWGHRESTGLSGSHTDTDPGGFGEKF